MTETHDHAAAQKRYSQRKQKSHKRICVYIPKDKVDEFKSSFKRLEKRWAK